MPPKPNLAVARLCAVLGVGLMILISRGTATSAIMMGTNASFAYRYSLRESMGIDPNAELDGLAYVREAPDRFNCSFLLPAGTTNMSHGTVTYVFQANPGFVIQHMSVFQRATLFGSGSVVGEWRTLGGENYEAFFVMPPYQGTDIGYERTENLRNVHSPQATFRYTLVLTNGFNFNVQFMRDCDDNPSAFQLNASLISERESMLTQGMIGQGATWKYWDLGSEPGPNWRIQDYDDNGWKEGRTELGYGDGDETTTVEYGPDPGRKFITTYFRYAFVVTNASAIDRLDLGVLRDDGIAVYLNGFQILRDNLPPGAITHETLAVNGVVNPEETDFMAKQIPAFLLRNGTNILAAEVHQSSPASSDISFDLDLSGVLKVPRLEIHRMEDCVVLSWPDTNFVLEEAPSLEGPWTLVPADPTSPFTVCGLLIRGFYRMKQPGFD